MGMQVFETEYESVELADLPRRTSLAVWLPDDWQVVPAESVVYGVETERVADHPWRDLPRGYVAEGHARDAWVRVSGTALLEGMHPPPESSRRVTALTHEVRWERRERPGRASTLRAWLADPGDRGAATAVLVVASGLSDIAFEDLLRGLRPVE